MKRAIIVALLFITSAIAQETIPFTDKNLATLGPSFIIRPEIKIHSTTLGETSYFTVNISNPGTVSFPQISILTNETYLQRATGTFSLKKEEAKTFKLSVKTNSSGIFISNLNFSSYDVRTSIKLIVLSNANNNTPKIVLSNTGYNTLEKINALITIPNSINSSKLYYGLINLEGEVMGVMSKTVLSNEEISISIPIPKEAIPGKYLFFTSLDQQSFSGKIIEITTLISIQTLIILGLLIVGVSALFQAGKLRKKENQVKNLIE
ncbi:MAG: hypothetical protein GON13_03960 [Nanoarchaeota archaeon]|nr:hypothetical protein [Nanoarchaeota archaeon]